MPDDKVTKLPVTKKQPDELYSPDLAEWERLFAPYAMKKKAEFDAYIKAGFTPEQAIALIK